MPLAPRSAFSLAPVSWSQSEVWLAELYGNAWGSLVWVTGRKGKERRT